MPHNHPPRCCCENTIAKQPDGTRITDPDQICTSCVIHGELAQLADNECPSCHQLPHRPPTDYCQEQGWHTMTRDEHCTCLGGPDRLGHMPDCPLYAATQLDGPKTLTSQPATRTTTPPTQVRGILDDVAHYEVNGIGRTHHRALCRPDLCGMEPKREPTPLATPTPPQCPSCGRYLTDPPGHRCRAADRHTHLE